jgi:hypothetical protein
MARQGRKSGDVPPGRWFTLAPGIRCRKHSKRKHGAQLDRYFVIRHSVDGKQLDEHLGWASQGWTVARAQAELSRLQEAKRTGRGPVTLREEAQAGRRAAELRAEQEAAEARRQKTVAELWDRCSKEVVAIENKPRTAAEKTRMWKRRIEPTIGQLNVNDESEYDAGAVVRSPLRLDAKRPGCRRQSRSRQTLPPAAQPFAQGAAVENTREGTRQSPGKRR